MSDQWPVKNPLTFMVQFDFSRGLQSDGNLKIKLSQNRHYLFRWQCKVSDYGDTKQMKTS